MFSNAECIPAYVLVDGDEKYVGISLAPISLALNIRSLDYNEIFAGLECADGIGIYG